MTRLLSFSQSDYELMMEALHQYVDEATTTRPKKEVLELANRLASLWLAQDKVKVEFLRRDTD